ncbi:MAG: hypothetical protein ACM3RR_00185 [Bacillota bacterium]
MTGMAVGADAVVISGPLAEEGEGAQLTSVAMVDAGAEAGNGAGTRVAVRATAGDSKDSGRIGDISSGNSDSALPWPDIHSATSKNTVMNIIKTQVLTALSIV